MNEDENNQETQHSTKKYFLIYKNTNNAVVILSFEDLNQIYDLVTKSQMNEGTYRVIKGVQVV